MELNSTIDPLIVARKSWEQKAFKASNEELYALLANCFDFYLAVARSYDLPKALNALLLQRGFTFTASTSLALKVIRLIFADPENQERHKNRLLTYARVLKVAKEQKQTAKTFVAFINSHGGVDEIRRSGTNAEAKRIAASKRCEDANAQFSAVDFRPMFKIRQLPEALQPVEGERFSLALVRRDADGSGAIVFGTGNKSVVQQVLAIAGKGLEEVHKHNALIERDAKQADRQEANLAAVKAAINESFSPELSFDIEGQTSLEVLS